MARHLGSVTVDNADDLPSPCRTCAFWGGGDLPSRDPSAKDDWLSAVLLDWGPLRQHPLRRRRRRWLRSVRPAGIRDEVPGPFGAARPATPHYC